MNSAATLKGLNRWLTAPATISGITGAGVATVYALFTIDFPPATVSALLSCIGVIVVVTVLLSDRYQQLSLQTLKKLGAGTLEPIKEHLATAVQETARQPDLAFWVAIISWFFAAPIVAVSYALVSQVSWQIAVRLAFVGLALAPLVATLGYLLTVVRTRKVLAKIAEVGLSPREVIAAIPPARMQLQRRMVIYAAIAVGTPLLMVTDMSVVRTERTLAQLLAQKTPAAQQQALDFALGTGWLTLAAAVGLVIVVVVACGYLSGTALGAPMRALVLKTQAMAKGKLGRGGVVPGEDEVWAAAAGFSSLEEQLVLVVGQLQSAGSQIELTTAQIVSSSARHKQGAGEQTAALSETSATTEELARSAKQIAQNATQVAGLATQTLTAARVGKTNADQFYSSILKVREGNQAIADSVVKLNKRVQQVGRIVEFIDGIADKSDLLALNAELEGNKAGDVGRGFSLVAAEMRRLSESVMTSTREIIGLIDEVRDATNAAVMATEAGVKASDTGSALAQKVSEGLGQILGFATETADAVERITLATAQQQVATAQLALAMSDILHSTQSGQGSQVRMTAANDTLQTLALELKTTVDRFEVG